MDASPRNHYYNFDDRHFDRDLASIEKQVRILREILDACSVVLPEGQFVLISRHRMKEIVEALDEHAGAMRYRLQKKVV